MNNPPARYGEDVLAKGWQRSHLKTSTEVELRLDMVLEDPTSGYVGAVVRWENGLVVLEDRKGRIRSFPIGPGLWLEGKPVAVKAPRKAAPAKATHTASGSLASATPTKAKVALPSRIFVEGRHDAELVEKIWGEDLRHVGVVVEFLGGIDDLDAIVTEFEPAPGRRLGVLVDHLVPGSKEQRIADTVARGKFGEFVFVTGHRYIDIWEAVKPEKLGLKAWPKVPKGEDFKHGICERIGWPHADQADIARAWKKILSHANSWTDLDRGLLSEVERLIDFVTQDHQQ